MTTNCFEDETANPNFVADADAARAFFGATKCKTAFDKSNPFSTKSLRRRLISGHRYANKHGVLFFTPPGKSDIDRVVEIQLSYLHKSYSANSNKIRGIFWDHGALELLGRWARRETRTSGGLSTIKSAIESRVRPVIEHSLPPSTGQHGCDIALYASPDSTIEAMSFCNEDKDGHKQSDECDELDRTSDASDHIYEYDSSQDSDSTSPGSESTPSRASALSLQRRAERSNDEDIQALVETEVRKAVEEATAPLLKRIEQLEKEVAFWKRVALLLGAALSFFIVFFFCGNLLRGDGLLQRFPLSLSLLLLACSTQYLLAYFGWQFLL